MVKVKSQKSIKNHRKSSFVRAHSCGTVSSSSSSLLTRSLNISHELFLQNQELHQEVEERTDFFTTRLLSAEVEQERLEEENSSLQQQLREVEAQFFQFQEQANMRQALSDQNNMELHRTITKLKDKLKVAKERTDTYFSAVSSANGKIVRLEDRRKELEREVTSLKNQLHGYKIFLDEHFDRNRPNPSS
jgi:chromosome segregation ATPase